MPSGQQLKYVFENQFAPRTETPAARMAGAQKFVGHFRRELGIETDTRGHKCIKDPAWQPQEFSLYEMAREFIGGSNENIEKQILNYKVIETLHGVGFPVFEAGGAVTPGDIPGVSAFLGSVSGLLDARMLAGYEQPDFIRDKLSAVIPTKTRQTRMIGLGIIGDDAEVRNPAEPHKRAQFEDRVVLTPETSDIALACEVTFEAVFFDQTNEVLQRAYSVGNRIGLREEKDFFRLFSGTTNAYNYNGSSFNTYLTTGNWVNDQVRLLEDWTDISTVRALASRMTDQETGNRITVKYDTLVCSPLKLPIATHVQRQTSIQSRTKSQAEIREGQLFEGLLWESTWDSPYLDEILTTASPNGLGLSQANADEYWWMVQTGSADRSAFIKTENWPFKVVTASPDSHYMLDHKVVLAAFADRMAVFSAQDPRFVVRNKPS